MLSSRAFATSASRGRYHYHTQEKPLHEIPIDKQSFCLSGRHFQIDIIELLLLIIQTLISCQAFSGYTNFLAISMGIAYSWLKSSCKEAKGSSKRGEIAKKL
jgi:hypothetical protein